MNASHSVRFKFMYYASLQSFIEVCVAAGYYASYWNMAFLPFGCADEELQDKDVYDTMIRVHPPSNKLANAVNELFVEIGWKTVVMIIR